MKKRAENAKRRRGDGAGPREKARTSPPILRVPFNDSFEIDVLLQRLQTGSEDEFEDLIAKLKWNSSWDRRDVYSDRLVTATCAALQVCINAGSAAGLTLGHLRQLRECLTEVQLTKLECDADDRDLARRKGTAKANEKKQAKVHKRQAEIVELSRTTPLTASPHKRARVYATRLGASPRTVRNDLKKGKAKAEKR